LAALVNELGGDQVGGAGEEGQMWRPLWEWLGGWMAAIDISSVTISIVERSSRNTKQ